MTGRSLINLAPMTLPGPVENSLSNSAAQQPMRASAYRAHPSIRNHWALRCMSRYSALVVSLKRDTQRLSPQASWVLIYRPTAVGMKALSHSSSLVPSSNKDVIHYPVTDFGDRGQLISPDYKRKKECVFVTASSVPGMVMKSLECRDELFTFGCCVLSGVETVPSIVWRLIPKLQERYGCHVESSKLICDLEFPTGIYKSCERILKKRLYFESLK
ncbi:uncharacterized protein TNCV_397301 [Trichonephila clavipes]|nr:uncharacterized protein TNCV_397301 [Trichonephila clavipes]